MQAEPRATYRLQLRPAFGFREAAKLVPYLAELGITHVYCSPIWQAVPGSEHGYDVVDPARINSELGGEDGWKLFEEVVERNGLSLLLDIVPNHMAIHADNPWWQDILRHGERGRRARYFDVDWQSPDGRGGNQVLLPLLGDHYGRVLEAGEISLHREQTRFQLHYATHRFPVDPASVAGLLERAAGTSGSRRLAFLSDVLANVDAISEDIRQRDIEVAELLLAECLADETIAAAIDDEIHRLNSDPDLLDDLVQQQNYRLAFWRTARQQLGYRRFFDIQSLAGLRTEDPRVFDSVHRLIIRLARRDAVDGLRVDHPDGLRDPAGYFRRLRDALPDAWLLAEKILGSGEDLPDDWPVDGTTGYEFLNRVAGLFIDPEGLAVLDATYRTFTGNKEAFSESVVAARNMVAQQLLGSELNRLTDLLAKVADRHRRYRDYTRRELADALVEICSRFPVYRSYVRPADGFISDDDRQHINVATEHASAARRDLDSTLVQFIRDILLLKVRGEHETEFVMRLQQFTAPLMAKGFEDTALFRFNRLVACNEVGSAPDNYPVSPGEFHRACEKRQQRSPCALLASDTHDTKYSGDVRARLAVLSEMPDEWRETVSDWSRRFHAIARPDAEMEYLFYQVLVGAWPVNEQRMQQFMVKAAREAKEHTDWARQDTRYEHKLAAFVSHAFNDDVFMDAVAEWVERTASHGYRNSLAQTLVKLTAPGVPDTYQGTECWAFSLVDPDNRRDVDFDALRGKLASLADGSAPQDVMAAAVTGLPKLWLTRQALHLRQRKPQAFRPGSAYQPLTVQGALGSRVVAYLRGEQVAVIVPRLASGIDDWADTAIRLPGVRWRNVLTHERFPGNHLPANELFRHFPVALLEREEKVS